MTKIFIQSSLVIASLLIWYFVVLAGKSPVLQNFNQCFVTSMNKVELCQSSTNYIPLSSVSKELVMSVVISEDASFYSHSGFDFFELKESFLKNIKRGQLNRGGSTITQQLVKNLYLHGAKTIGRKITEMYLAIKIEKKLSKKEILELYLNIAEFGHGIYGIKSASLFYFNKNPGFLTLSESAYLAQLLPSPVKYSQSFLDGSINDDVRDRMTTIVNKLARFGKISEDEHFEVVNEISYFSP